MENAECVTPGTDTLNGVGNTVNGVNSAASLSEDSRDSSSSISYTPRPRGRGLRGRPPWKGRGRGRPRGSYSMDPELRRKNKLREVCTINRSFLSVGDILFLVLIPRSFGLMLLQVCKISSDLVGGLEPDLHGYNIRA